MPSADCIVVRVFKITPVGLYKPQTIGEYGTGNKKDCGLTGMGYTGVLGGIVSNFLEPLKVTIDMFV